MFHPRTLSFWLSTFGVVAIFHPKTRNLGIIALFAVSWGAIGGIYFRVAERFGEPVEPLAVFPRLRREDYISALKHAVFLVPAIWALRRR